MKKQTSLDKFRAAAAQRAKEAEQRRKEMEARHTQGKEDMKGAIDRLAASMNREEFGGMVGGSPISNNVGDGNIAGLGVGKQSEPGVPKKKKNVVPFGMFTRKKPV